MTDRQPRISDSAPTAADGAASKHAKYATRNPISRYLLQRFLAAIERVVVPLGAGSLLDVGCGEGMVLKSLRDGLAGTACAAIDLDPIEVADARRNLPWCQVGVGSVYDLPYGDGSFELVLCCEVLEHLERPRAALSELARVSSRHVLVSVPREPLWRGLNMARGAYCSAWGDTPDHRNHWSGRSFERFVAGELEVLRRLQPLPWTVVLARKR